MNGEEFRRLRCPTPNGLYDQQYNIQEDKGKENKGRKDKGKEEIGIDLLQICSSNGNVEAYINRHGTEGKDPNSYLAVIGPFSGTFQEWFDVHKSDLFCHMHAERLKEKRPREELRRIFVGMKKAVAELHESGNFHGNLGNKHNYAFSYDTAYSGDGDTEFVEVILLHIKGQFNKRRVGHMTKQELHNEMKNDREALRDLIFVDVLGIDKVIPGDDAVIPTEIIHLRDHIHELDGIKLWRHPGFWHFSRRVYYYTDLHSKYFDTHGRKREDLKEDLNTMICADGWETTARGNNSLTQLFPHDGVEHDGHPVDTHGRKRAVIKEALNTTTCADGWETMARGNDSLTQSFSHDGVEYDGHPVEYDGHRVKYDGHATSLIRFMKNATLHLHKNVPGISIIQVDKILRDTFPTFVVESYTVMGAHGIFFYGF